MHAIAERFLRMFTDVRPSEGSTAWMMFANVFLILLVPDASAGGRSEIQKVAFRGDLAHGR